MIVCVDVDKVHYNDQFMSMISINEWKEYQEDGVNEMMSVSLSGLFRLSPSSLLSLCHEMSSRPLIHCIFFTFYFFRFFASC